MFEDRTYETLTVADTEPDIATSSIRRFLSSQDCPSVAVTYDSESDLERQVLIKPTLVEKEADQRPSLKGKALNPDAGHQRVPVTRLRDMIALPTPSLSGNTPDEMCSFAGWLRKHSEHAPEIFPLSAPLALLEYPDQRETRPSPSPEPTVKSLHRDALIALLTLVADRPAESTFVVPILTDRLETFEPVQRILALETIRAVLLKSPDAAPPIATLRPFFEDEDDRVRAATALCAAAIAEHNPAAVVNVAPQLVTALDDNVAVVPMRLDEEGPAAIAQTLFNLAEHEPQAIAPYSETLAGIATAGRPGEKGYYNRCGLTERVRVRVLATLATIAKTIPDATVPFASALPQLLEAESAALQTNTTAILLSLATTRPAETARYEAEIRGIIERTTGRRRLNAVGILFTLRSTQRVETRQRLDSDPGVSDGPTQNPVSRLAGTGARLAVTAPAVVQAPLDTPNVITVTLKDRGDQPVETAAALESVTAEYPEVVDPQSLIMLLPSDDTYQRDEKRVRLTLRAIANIAEYRPLDCRPALPSLRALLKPASETNRRQILQILAVIGAADGKAVAPAVPVIQTCLADGTTAVRADAVWCLEALSERVPAALVPAVPALVQAVEDNVSLIDGQRETTTRHGAVRTIVAGITGDDTDGRFSGLQTTRPKRTREAALETLAAVATDRPDDVAAFTDTYMTVATDSSAANAERVVATEILGHITETGQYVYDEYVKELQGLLDAPDPRLRGNALALIFYGTSHRSRLLRTHRQELIALCSHAERAVRVNTSKLLIPIAEECPAVLVGEVDALRELQDARDRAVGNYAHQAREQIERAERFEDE